MTIPMYRFHESSSITEWSCMTIWVDMEIWCWLLGISNYPALGCHDLRLILIRLFFLAMD